MNLLQKFLLAIIEHLYTVPRWLWLVVSSLTNNRRFENQLHAAGAHLALVMLNKQHAAIIKLSLEL